MTEPTPVRHIDYREAFVLDIELEAHGLDCKTCTLAAIQGNDDFCMKMKHMREAITMAYEALPLYYKNRYKAALERRVSYHTQVVSDLSRR